MLQHISDLVVIIRAHFRHCCHIFWGMRLAAFQAELHIILHKKLSQESFVSMTTMTMLMCLVQMATWRLMDQFIRPNTALRR